VGNGDAGADAGGAGVFPAADGVENGVSIARPDLSGHDESID
jgi:hypothetical protein